MLADKRYGLSVNLIATKVLPQYEADDGALTKAQLSQIKKSAPKAKGGQVRSSLFEMEATEFVCNLYDLC